MPAPEKRQEAGSDSVTCDEGGCLRCLGHVNHDECWDNFLMIPLASHPEFQPQPLPDLLSPDLDVLFCGINPGLSAAATGHHFMGRSNRFWRTMHLAGFTPELIDPVEDRRILDYGCGLTTVVERPTASALEVEKNEFIVSSLTLQKKVEKYQPRCLAFLGKPAYQAISGKAKVAWGRQAEPFGGAMVWLLPNPSGLNRGFRLEDLVAAYRELRMMRAGS